MNSSPLRTLLSRRVCRCTSAQLPPTSSANVARLLSSSTRSHGAAHSTFSSPVPAYGSSELLRRRYQKNETPTPFQKDKADRARIVQRMRWSAYGIALCTLAMFGTIYMYPNARAEKGTGEGKKTNVVQLDAPASSSTVVPDSAAPEGEQVATGTSHVPFFPKTIHISSEEGASSTAGAAGATQQDVEYQLVGLGVRTVSLLSIQVYVVGLYIAVADIAALQERLVHAVADPVATTLVPGEKTQLRDLLLHPDRGEEVWNAILKDGQLRTAFRIVPTRSTDFMHLRDGFVRGITARSAHFAADRNDPSFQDDSFGAALNDFKSAFGGSARRKLPKGEVLLLARDAHGNMSVWNEGRQGDRLKMGDIPDERVGRLLWLGYLAGKNVSSEPARQSVVDGVMEFVERPVGTVATQVV